MNKIEARCETVTGAEMSEDGRFAQLIFSGPDALRVTMPADGIDALAAGLPELSLQLKLRQYAALSEADLLETPADFNVTQVFITSGLRSAEFDSHGTGVTLTMQSAEKPHTGLQLILAAGDAQGMIDALQGFARQLQDELSRRPQAGPQVQ